MVMPRPAAKLRQMTRTQAEAARHIVASADGLIRPFPGGYWTTVRDGRREAWSTSIHTVRAMQAHGWLVRSRMLPEAWLDPRRLTDAGRAALARAACPSVGVASAVLEIQGCADASRARPA